MADCSGLRNRQTVLHGHLLQGFWLEARSCPVAFESVDDAPLTVGPLSSEDATVTISAETYARLMRLADQAPLECLPLSTRTLAQAKTLGYNQIGQIRSTPPGRLLADLGEDRADELRRALYDFGMRQPDSPESAI